MPARTWPRSRPRCATANRAGRVMNWESSVERRLDDGPERARLLRMAAVRIPACVSEPERDRHRLVCPNQLPPTLEDYRCC